MAGVVPGWSRDCQSNSGIQGYSAIGVVVVAGLVPGWSWDRQSKFGVREYSATEVAGLVPGWSRDCVVVVVAAVWSLDGPGTVRIYV